MGGQLELVLNQNFKTVLGGQIYDNYIYNQLVGYILLSVINCVFLKKGNPVHSINLRGNAQ